MIKKKKILISGAGGFLGTNLCLMFSELNFDIVCVDKDKFKLNLLKKKLLKFKNTKHFFNVNITNEKKVIEFSNFLKKKKFLC